MKGDILIVLEEHRRAALKAFNILKDIPLKTTTRFIITVAGESGAGKSEIAATLAGHLTEAGIKTYLIQQDDYFRFPPKTNAARRVEDIGNVGDHEVRLDLLDENLVAFLRGEPRLIKPLVDFDADTIGSETVILEGIQCIITEGTYCTLLKNADYRIFIDRDYNDTRPARLLRNRERQDEYLERILLIEHKIISQHKKLADIIITKDFNAEPNEKH